MQSKLERRSSEEPTVAEVVDRAMTEMTVGRGRQPVLSDRRPVLDELLVDQVLREEASLLAR